MPVWNAMPWLPEAMESLFQQTTEGFEILVVADVSTDGSTEYLRTLRDPRLRVVERPRAGLTAALNRLLEETRTPWLVRMDADDVSYPTRIERLQAAIEAHPEAGLIYSLADYHPRERCAGRFRCSRGTPEQLRSMVERGYLLSFAIRAWHCRWRRRAPQVDTEKGSAPRMRTYGGGWRENSRSFAFPSRW